MDAGRQSERGLRFLLELQVQRRQCRAEAEGPWREQHVLHRGMTLPRLISVPGEL